MFTLLFLLGIGVSYGFFLYKHAKPHWGSYRAILEFDKNQPPFSLILALFFVAGCLFSFANFQRFSSGLSFFSLAPLLLGTILLYRRLFFKNRAPVKVKVFHGLFSITRISYKIDVLVIITLLLFIIALYVFKLLP